MHCYRDPLWKSSLDFPKMTSQILVRLRRLCLLILTLPNVLFGRSCRPEKAETFRQFSGRLASYLDKWLGLAKVEKTYEAVCDFFA